MKNIDVQNFFAQNEISAFIKEKAASQDFSAFMFTALLHISLVFFIFFQYKKASFDQTLSFSMTVMDVSSSSSNVVASSASVASKTSAKAPQKSDEKAQNAQSANDNSQYLQQEDSTNSKSDKSFDSQARSAVLTPDSEASIDAANLNNKAPRYPEISRQIGEKGTVILKVYVSEEGLAQIVEMKKSSGFARLDNSALATVKQWRFLAARKSGKLVASWINIPIRFALE